jgi:hypothetical protein
VILNGKSSVFPVRVRGAVRWERVLILPSGRAVVLDRSGTPFVLNRAAVTFLKCLDENPSTARTLDALQGALPRPRARLANELVEFVAHLRELDVVVLK